MSVTTFLDSFDHYATTDILKKWDSKVGTVTVEASGGRRDTPHLKITPEASARVLKTVPSSAYITIGCAVKISESDIQAGVFNLLLTLFESGAPQCLLTVDKTTKLLQFWRQDYNGSWNNPTLLATSNTALTLDSWQHLELGVNIGNTGSVELRINGSAAAGITQTSCDTSYTGNSICNAVALGSSDSGYIVYKGLGNFDDFKVSYGTALLWHGDRRVDPIPLSANFTQQDWAVSSGDAYAALNGNGENIQSSTPGDISRFVVADPSFTPNLIDTIQVIAKVQKSDAGNRAVKLEAGRYLESWEGTSSSDLYLSETLKYVTAEFPTDPSTGVAWTESALRELIVGLELSV